jgi:hypothetical protein
MARLVLFILVVIGTQGCGDDAVKTYPVTAKLSFPDGGTVEGAIVAFRSISGPNGNHDMRIYSAIGKVQADGTCQLTTFKHGDGAVAGRHQVTVGPPPNPGGDADDGRQPSVAIHRRFANADTSGLEFTVTPEGANEFLITLEHP